MHLIDSVVSNKADIFDKAEALNQLKICVDSPKR